MNAKNLTVEDVAERWSCAGSYVRRLCRERKLRYWKLGTAYRVPLDAVEDFERERTAWPDHETDEPATASAPNPAANGSSPGPIPRPGGRGAAELASALKRTRSGGCGRF